MDVGETDCSMQELPNEELSAAQIQNIDIAMEEIVPNVLISNNVIANNPTTEAHVYPHNELWKHLRTQAEGRGILDAYLLDSKVDREALARIGVLYLIEKNQPYSFNITGSQFQWLADEIQTLFPTEFGSTYYKAPYKGSDGSSRSASGKAYHFYRTRRILFARANYYGNIDDEVNENVEDATTKIVYNCLTDPNQAKYSANTILQEWNKEYLIREELVLKAKGKVAHDKLAQYFDSYPCITPPLGLSLLEEDFSHLIDSRIKSKQLGDIFGRSLLSAFSDKWPTVAKKILVYLSSQKKNKVIKSFIDKHDALIKAENCNEILALSILPHICHTNNKKIKVKVPGESGNTEVEKSLTVSKSEIERSFMLHVTDVSNEQQLIKEHQNWLIERNQHMYPFIVIVGPIDNLSEISINFKSEKYSYTSITRAFEVLCKVFYAVHNWPVPTDHLYYFFNKTIYKLKDIDRNLTQINTLVSDLLL